MQIYDVKSFKIDLMKIITSVIDKNNWRQWEAAKILRVNQPSISYIKYSKDTDVTLGILLLIMLRLRYDVSLVINLQKSEFVIQVQPPINDIKLKLKRVITNAVKQNNLPKTKADEIINIYPPGSRMKSLKIQSCLIEHFISSLIALGCIALGCAVEAKINEKILVI